MVTHDLADLDSDFQILVYYIIIYYIIIIMPIVWSKVCKAAESWGRFWSAKDSLGESW